MSIVKMKHIRLFGMSGDREALLRGLQHLGCVEVQESAGERDGPAWAAFARVDDTALADTKARAEQLREALKLLDHSAPAKKKLLQPRPQVTEGQLFDEPARREALAAAEKVLELDRRENALRNEENKLQVQKASLAPWLELETPLELASTREVSVTFGAVAARTDRRAAELAADEAAGGLVELQWAGRDRDFQYVLVLCHRSAEEAVFALLKTYGFAPAALRGWTGTARANTDAIDARLREIGEERKACRAGIAGEAPHREAIRLYADRLAQDIQREETKGRLLASEGAFFLEGWVPAEKLPRVEALLDRYPAAWEARDPDPEEYPQVPVELKNNAFTRPLNMVTEMYSLPAYDGLDPNPLMAPFFILFYGIMMADMGYGLVMMILGGVVLAKAKPKGTVDYLFSLMVLCGASTFLMGALTGGFFGDFLTQLFQIMDPESTFELPALFTPLNDTLAILIGALVLGFLQVITGMIISFVKQTRDGCFLDALFNEGAWWVIYAGAALAILGIGSVGGVPVVLLIGGIMLVIGCLRQNRSIAVVGTIVYAVYNGVTGIFSDVLSYSRLMALMLSGSIIASVFNTLGATAGNVVVFVIISFIGNALNFGLNILGCFVHDLRLQCLEFFGKFYKDGGKPFRPLAIRTKYVDIVKEEN